jgi:glycosyltransferase involved in cell wall biosynthesis
MSRMRVLLVFNLPSHHILPLARCLAKLVGEDSFRYGGIYQQRELTESHIRERRRLGWNDDSTEPWILRAYQNEADREEFERWWDEADVVLCGERRYDRMKDRLDKGKLTFHYTERWWKPPYGMARLLHPRFALMTLRFRQLERSPYFHYQAMGGYAADDMRRIASFEGRMWKWGYFTATPDPLPPCERKEPALRVLWAGRMDRLKGLDTLIRAFPLLLAERQDACLTLIGYGPELDRLQQLARKLLPVNSYCFLPPIPAVAVLESMRHHHIYVFPSTGWDGWGAVVNEAMGEGCAVIASREAGAPKAMIRHGENGLLFKPGDWKSLGENLCRLGRDESLRLRLAQEGQRTIAQCWSPAIAAERFVSVCDSLLSKRPIPTFNDGPMAPA